MLTGDALLTAEAIHKQVGTDEVIAGVLPADKEKIVRNLSQKGGLQWWAMVSTTRLRSHVPIWGSLSVPEQI